MLSLTVRGLLFDFVGVIMTADSITSCPIPSLYLDIRHRAAHTPSFDVDDADAAAATHIPHSDPSRYSAARMRSDWLRMPALPKRSEVEPIEHNHSLVGRIAHTRKLVQAQEQGHDQRAKG